MTGKVLGSFAFVLALALIIQSEKLAQRLFPLQKLAVNSGEPIAVVVATNGEALFIGPSAQRPENLEPTHELRHQDQIRTLESGTATVRLAQGEVIEIEKSSHVLFEQPQEQELNLIILNGRIRNQQVSPLSRVKVFFHTKSYPLSQLSRESFTINSGKRKKAAEKLPPNTASSTGQATDTQKAKEDAALAKNVQSVMANQKFWLDKCYANYLKTNPQGFGEIKVLFSIEKDGQVRETKVQSSTINDSTMENCVLQIVKRARFNPVSEDGNHQFIFPFQFSSQ